MTLPLPARHGCAALGTITATALGLISPARVLADCLLPPQGAPIQVVVRTCRAIQAASDPEVRAHARLDGPGALVGAATVSRLYTGALITDTQGQLWMAPSTASDPCRGVRPGSTLAKRASFTCCDTGRWGKCVFGGRFLAAPDQPAINAFQ